MQHSLVFICSRKLMMIFTGAFFLLVSLGTSSGVFYQHKNVTLSLRKIVSITSPGYSLRNYERDTIYTWDVRADDGAEEIYITIMMDIAETTGFSCEDYLLIQEITLSGYFTQFKQCGQRKEHRIIKGNRLLVTLVSNHDKLTSRGFKLILYVIKMGSIMSPKVPTKARTTPSTKTTDRHMSKVHSTKSTSPTRILLKSTPMLLITVPLKTTTTTQILTSLTTPTTTKITSTQSTTSTTPLTTTTTTKSTIPIELTTPSTQTASSLKITDGNSKTISTDPTVRLFQSSQNLYASSIHQSSKKEVTTQRLSSFQSAETRKTSYQTTTETQLKQYTTSETTNMTTLMDIATDEGAESLGTETVILLIGLGILEVTLIIVGVLAIQRYRRKRKNHPSRQARKRNDDHTNTLKRQNSCGETHVYDEIDIDYVKEEEEENQYKALPEGVYDTTLKRRSHVKVVGEPKSYYSRGSIINLFRTSSFFGRKKNETSVMTFSTFKDPIQSQIGEKSNQ